MSIQVLLEDKITKILDETPEYKESGKNNFEIAVCHILNLRYLSGLDCEDLLDGIIGDGGDEGIDACFLFINDVIVKEFDPELITKSSSIRLEIIQAKKSKGFSTSGFDKCCQGVEEIFTLDKPEFDAIGANEDLIEKAETIREVFRDANKKGAAFELRIHYATIGDSNDLDDKIDYYKNKLNTDLKWAFKEEIDFEFWGAQELNDTAHKTDEQIELEFADSPLDISETDSALKGFAGFVEGIKFINSVIDDNQRLKEELTEGNIRFFLGEDVGINTDIIETAQSESADQFWAMNNGITILCEKIRPGSKNIKIITNPQIVNGCQTTHCLYEVFKQNNTLDPKLKVFIKLVETSDSDIQQDIINATNSQNKVATASLKANDKIQRNIEDSLKPKDIYYERRKNFYKRKGKTGLSVMSLEKMAQITHTIYRKEAIRAVNHTKDLFSQTDLYKKIFNEKADLDIYYFAVKLYQKMWSLKNSDLRSQEYEEETKELISKSLFCLLHISSSLLFNEVNSFDISQPPRKNFFSENKDDYFKALDDEKKMDRIYFESKKIFLDCATKYNIDSGKVKNTLFKNRGFDKDYIIPAVENHLHGDQLAFAIEAE